MLLPVLESFLWVKLYHPVVTVLMSFIQPSGLFEVSFQLFLDYLERAWGSIRQASSANNSISFSVFVNELFKYINPCPGRVFSITRPGRGGVMRPPWRFETKRRSASRKIPIDFSRRVLAIGGTFFP